MKVKTSRKTLWKVDDRKCVLIVKSIDFNLNDFIQVELTEYGLETWRESIADVYETGGLENAYPDKEQFINAIVTPRHITDNWYEFQVHDFWSIFKGRCSHTDWHEGRLRQRYYFNMDVRYLKKDQEIIEPAQV